MLRTILPAAVFLSTVLHPSDQLHAQAAGDWLAWHGCWEAEGGPVDEFLCIVSDGAAGVRMVTVTGAEVLAESRVIADGQPRRVVTDGCTGNEVALWSADHQRVFLRSELDCEGGVMRQASGVLAITSAGSWISVQAVTIDGQTATRAVRYTAVNDAVAPAVIQAALRSAVADRVFARGAALAVIDADDISEAVDQIDAVATQAWLTETEQPFQLADEAASGAPTGSVLDQTGAYGQPVRREVHIVERPVEVVHVVERPVYATYVYRYRTCWDPFHAGVVIGAGALHVSVGRIHCGGSYRVHYSPWGYDLYGWRYVRTRPIIIAGRPIIYYCEPNRPVRVVYPTRRTARHYTPAYPPDRGRTAQPRDSRQVTNTVRSGTGAPPRTAQPRALERNNDPREVSSVRSAPNRGLTPREQPTVRSTPDRGATPREQSSVRSTPDRNLTPRQQPSVRSTPDRAAQPRSSGSSPGASTARAPVRSVTPSTSRPQRTTQPAARVARPREAGGG